MNDYYIMNIIFVQTPPSCHNESPYQSFILKSVHSFSSVVNAILLVQINYDVNSPIMPELFSVDVNWPFLLQISIMLNVKRPREKKRERGRKRDVRGYK